MVSQTETVRGKERLQQLMEQFPEIRRSQVLSLDTTREGIKANETTRQLGRWALPDAPAFFDRNKEQSRKSAERTEGYYLSPLCGYFGDGASFQLLFDSRSPYEIRYEERGRYRLYRDGEPIEEVFFPPRPQWYDRKTSSGKPMPSVIKQREDDLILGALIYCEYGKDNLTCKYCNTNSSWAANKETGLVTLSVKRDQDLYETMLAACQESQQRRMVVSGGVLLNTSKEADNYARIVRVLRRAEKDAGYEKPMQLNVKCQAMELENTMKLKEAGVTVVGFNMEVWDPRLWDIICPGKAKYVGREKWLERLVQAVEVFGEGRVATTLPQGLELMEPYGFKSEDEGAASYLEGIEWLLAHGIRAAGPPLRCVPGTEFEGRYSARTEYFLRLAMACSALYKKYNMADPAKAGPLG